MGGGPCVDGEGDVGHVVEEGGGGDGELGVGVDDDGHRLPSGRGGGGEKCGTDTGCPRVAGWVGVRKGSS